MIVAGVVLVAVGLGDLARAFVGGRARWFAYGGAALATIAIALLAWAPWTIVPAVLLAAGWLWLVPSDGTGRFGLWPVAVLGVLCTGAVVLLGSRAEIGGLATFWHPAAPWGSVSVDVAVLAVGAALFLLESGNVVVRSALRQESPADGATDDVAAIAPVRPPVTALKGGRLIGPLERILVFALTLAGAFTLLAAVIAAKGIVRFPEISRDGESGGRAEYFLVGSLVSWTVALAGAFLVWWSVAVV